LLKDLLSPMSASDKRQLAALLKTGLYHIAAAEDESA
jgi:hypothetical protein